MLSDILFEAHQDIEQCQRNSPEIYEQFSDWIEAVKSAMVDLQIHLDTQPYDDLPEFERIEAEVGHYVSRHSFGVIRCTVHRNLTSTHEARNDPSLFTWRITVPVEPEFRTSIEGLAREAVRMAARLRQMAGATKDEALDEQQQSDSTASITPSVPTNHPMVNGRGTIEGDIDFSIKITNPDYTTEEVRDKMLTGDLYCYYGDSVLSDENKIEVVGNIEWGIGRADFVPFEVEVQPSPRPERGKSSA